MFQAPDTDANFSAGGFTAPAGDFDVPSSYLKKTASNIVPDIKSIGAGLKDLVEGPALDIASGDAVSAVPKLAKQAEQFWDNPKENAAAMVRPVTHPVDYFQEHPVSQAMNVVGALSAAKGLMGGAEAAAETPEVAPEMAAKGSPRDLPVIEPGSKTGDPHALFSYNDKYGPGGTERSNYTMYGDPEHPTFQKTAGSFGGHGSTGTKAQMEELGVPIVGREPRSVGKWEPLDLEEPKPTAENLVKMEGAKGPAPEPASRIPPDPNAPAPKAPEPAVDPLQDVKDYLKRTQGKVEAVPGWQEKMAKYVKNEVGDLRAKDIGMRDPMIRSLDPKHPLQALQKAEDLMGYAGEKGYFKPGLTDVARKDMIKAAIDKTGENVGAIRKVAGQRAQAPVAEIREAIKNELTDEYGAKASREIETVLGDFDRMVKKDPSFDGLSKVATYLNGEKSTFNKIGQNPGPTTDAANTLGRLNNEAIRKVLSPEENNFYTQNLRDFGAHKSLEKMVASSGRRAMTGRGAPGGALSSLWQQLWDRGGYRMAGNVADRVSTGILKNPGKIKTLPDFFEELAHHSGDVLDETINGMYEGGRVPDDVRAYVSRC